MNRRGMDAGMILQLVVWSAILILAAYLIYANFVQGGSGPLPGEGLLTP